MAVQIQSFSPHRALAAMMYLVREASSDMYTVLKMLYVADKIHMSKCGEFISGDSYVAMKQGATPSGVYDMIKYVRGDGRNDRGLQDAVRYFALDKTHRLTLLQEVPEEYLSQFAKESLDAVVQMHRAEGHKCGFWWRKAHDPAWGESRDGTSEAPSMDQVSIARTIPNNNELLEYLADPFQQ